MYGNRPTTRLLSMLELLQTRGRIGGPELARRLEVGERTVRRYAVMLQEMGVPVEGERGRYGAYSLKRGYKVPPMMFTDEEALGLALGLLAARTLGLVGVAPAVEGALAKLERVMPEALRGRVQNLEETVSIAIARPTIPADSETFLTLAAAVGERRRVRLRYRSGWAGESERVVDLYGVMQREGYWYAAGHCHLRGSMRLFRLDRVLEAEMLDDTFARPAGLDSPGAVLSAVASTPGDEWSVEVLLETSAEDARWQLPSVGLALEQAEGGTLLRCSTWSLDWIARVLAGLDCPFIVRRPEELREALERRAEKIATLSKRTERAAAHP
ncbi:MAG: YafY family transcriptional regulator [Actinomycetota bacterium]|nr:YafY family transcriptional regulator [Actinomycetota bacterium]